MLDKYQYLSKQERAFLTRLTEGTVERGLTLDYVIDAFSKTKVHKMKPVIRNVLRMGVYQLLYMDGVPDSAVCNEAVKLVRKRGLSGLSGFVNGVLRNIARQADAISWPKEEEHPVQALSVRYSVPEWIVREWLNSYGPAQTREMLAALGEESKLTIRTNTGKCTPEELRVSLEAQGVRVEPVGNIPYGFSLSGYDYLG